LQTPGVEALPPELIILLIVREPPTPALFPEQARTRTATKATTEARPRAARIRGISQSFMTRTYHLTQEVAGVGRAAHHIALNARPPMSRVFELPIPERPPNCRATVAATEP
jgi:hypothetical protein